MITMQVPQSPHMAANNSTNTGELEGVSRLFRRLSVDVFKNASHVPDVVVQETSDTGYKIKGMDYVDAHQIRSEVKKLLILCLKTQLGQSQVTNTEKIANVLEQRLFQMAPTIADYGDLKTLEFRLGIALQLLRNKSLMKISQKRSRLELMSKSSRSSGLTSTERQQQQQQQQSTAPSTADIQQQRAEWLQKNLGADRYSTINDLVRSISYECNDLVGSTCPKCQFKGEKFTGTFGAQLPKPVRHLFFDTPIVQVWLEWSMDRLSSKAVEWDTLVQDAESNLRIYHEWKAQNYVCALR